MNSLRSAGFKSWFSSDAIQAEGRTFHNSLAHSKWAREMKHLEVQLPKRRSLKSVTKQNSASNFRYSVLEKITMKNELWLEFWQHTRNTIYFHAISPIYSHCCKIWLQEHIYPLGILTRELQTCQFWQPSNFWWLPHQTDWNWRTWTEGPQKSPGATSDQNPCCTPSLHKLSLLQQITGSLPRTRTPFLR